MDTKKINEGVMGGVLAMPAINRMMQLAGLEHSGAVVAEETQLTEAMLFEEEASDMLDKLAASAENLPDYKDNPEAARIYAAGALLSSLAKSMNDSPPQTVAGQQLVGTIKALAPMGANAIKVAGEIAAKAKPAAASTTTTGMGAEAE